MCCKSKTSRIFVVVFRENFIFIDESGEKKFTPKNSTCHVNLLLKIKLNFFAVRCSFLRFVLFSDDFFHHFLLVAVYFFHR